MSEEDVECLIHGQEDSQGNINYEQFVRMVCQQLISNSLIHEFTNSEYFMSIPLL